MHHPRETMTTFLHFTYNCLHLLNQYIGTFWPVKVFFGIKHLQPPSTDTELKVLRIFYLLHHKSDITKFGFDIQLLITSLPLSEDVLSITDRTMGYNLLQLAIIDGDQDLVTVLMKWQYNVYKQCSPPVHLAASLGYLSILEHLLDNGGKSNLSAGICFPHPHQPVQLKKWLGIIDEPVYKCNLNRLLPIYWAIARDNVSCFVLLLNHMTLNGEITPDPVDLLHFACRRGSNGCIGKILLKNPLIVNSLDTNKDTPLLLAVVWGRACSKTLIDNGADVKIVSNIGETALHRLYRNDIDGLFTIYETTKYLLTTGIEQLVNSKNSNREMPLHVLVSHVSYVGGSLLHPDDLNLGVPRTQLQPDYQDQIINTLDLLLKFNADPGIRNSRGLHPLAKLMHIALKSCTSEKEQCECIRTSISSIYRYKNDYGHLYSALDVLVNHESEFIRPCPEGHTPLVLMLLCVLNDNMNNLSSQMEDVVKIVNLLLGNSTNMKKSSDKFTMLLAKIASRYFNISSEDMSNDYQLKVKYSLMVIHLLETFLKKGLNPNLVTDIRSKHLKGGRGNSLIEFVSLTELARKPEDFIEIHKWLKTLLTWGANPDLESYQSEPIICHSQSSIFLKRERTQAVRHYIHEVQQMDNAFSNGNAQELLMLFYNTMSHDVLYNCLMSRLHPLGATGKTFLKMLNNLGENPRSLKQIARVVIYKSIDRQTVQNVHRLPLPTLLKNYLIEIH